MSAGWMDGLWGEGNGSASEISNLCASKTIHNITSPPYSMTLHNTIRVISSCFNIATFVLGILLNSFVIYLVAKYKKLQTLPFLVSLQLIVMNLLLSSAVYLLHAISAIANKWLFGEIMCVVTGFVYAAITGARSFLMLSFVIDRFCSVFFLYSYPRISKKTMLVLSLVSWLLIMLPRIIDLPGILDCYGYFAPGNICTVLSSCSSQCSVTILVFFTIIFGPSTILPAILYGMLYWKARKIRKSDKELAAASGIGRKNIPPTEWKTTITFLLFYIAVFSLNTPTIFVGILVGVLVQSGIAPSSSLAVFALFNIPISLLMIIDPIILMRHRDMQDIILTEIWGKLTKRCCGPRQGEENPQREIELVE